MVSKVSRVPRILEVPRIAGVANSWCFLFICKIKFILTLSTLDTFNFLLFKLIYHHFDPEKLRNTPRL